MLSPCDKDPQNLVMCQISFTCSKTLVVGRRFVGYIHMKLSRFFYLTSFFARYLDHCFICIILLMVTTLIQILTSPIPVSGSTSTSCN